MIELNEPLQHALDAHPDKPIRVLDPRTQEVYVLLRADDYERLKAPPDDDSEIEIRDGYPLMDEVAAKEGWNDPEMESHVFPRG